MRRGALIVVLACLTVPLRPVTARAQGAGRSLDIQPGARQNGMGAAGVASMQDPTDGLWWNPAMLAFGRRPSTTLTYAKLVPGLSNDVRYWNGGMTVPVTHAFGLGLGFTYLDYGVSRGRDENGNFTGNFSAHEASPCISTGLVIVPDLAVGATLKQISIKLSDAVPAASGVGFDVGVLYRHQMDGITVSAGVTANNLGPEITFTPFDSGSPLTRNVRMGIAGQFMSPPTPEGLEFGTSFALDRYQTILPGGEDANYATTHYGAEVFLGMHQVMRLAFRAGYYDDPEGQIGDATFGVGVRVLGLTADFGAIPQARNSGLERVKKWTLGYHFDPFPRMERGSI